MSYIQFASSRATIASAALLSLVVLAGCQSTASTKETGSASSDLANTSDGAGVVVDGPGPSLLEELTMVGDRVHFALDRYDLSPEAEATLQRQAALIQDFEPATVTIQGHADERGTREYNLALGERRADSVRNYLIALGIPPERISIISYGKERPECADAAESCWSQNRRGVTIASQ